MAIRYRCTCGANIRMPVSAAGKRARCRSCGAIFTVPDRNHDPARQPIPLEPDRSDKTTDNGSADEPGSWLEEFARSESQETDQAPATIMDVGGEPPARAEPEDIPAARTRRGVDEDHVSPDEDRDWISRPEQPFWRDLLESFIFFVDARNFITFMFIILLVMVPKLLPLPVVAWVLGMLASFYVCAFFLNIVRETASGEDELPNVWISSIWDDVILPLVRFWGTWVWVLLPAIVVALYGLSEYGSVPWAIVKPLVVVGLFLWPAVVLGVSIGGSFSGLWPHVVVRTALAAPVPYLAVCGAVVAAYFIMVLPDTLVFASLAGKLPALSTRAFESFSAALGVYAVVVAMRVIGLYYRHYKHKLPWVAE